MKTFSHIDEKGSVRMVDITDKEPTLRSAVAQGVISMHPDTFKRIQDRSVKKGNVLETARIAGIIAAKKTSELIPMCHPIHITYVSVDFFPDKDENFIIKATVRTLGQTGVEMEALTAACVAALTIYDMCKSYDRDIVITDICLIKKTGGKSKTFVRDNQP